MAGDQDQIFNTYEFAPGETPLFVSMPHSGLELTNEVASCLTDKARALPDTDWYIPELYSFLQNLGVGHIRANYSRYVIDLNRPLDDRPLYASKTTGLFPDILFDGNAVFGTEQRPSDRHREICKRDIWQSYHAKIDAELTRIKTIFGYAILFDAHSIAARVPMLFDGILPDFNFGNNNAASCASNLMRVVAEGVANSDYSYVCNGRFKGGYITRSFGDPDSGIHTIQLELSQATYLEESINEYQIDQDKLSRVTPLLEQLIKTLTSTVPESLL